MIHEITKNVKEKITLMIRELNDHLTRPMQKYLIEMITGCFATKSLCLTSISGSLHEKTDIKHTLKRLQRNTEKYSDLLDISNSYNAHYASEETKGASDIVICVDGGDIVHKYGSSFELNCKVRDGSDKKSPYKMGYHINHAVCYEPNSKRVYPLYLNIYSSKSKEFKSANIETLKMLDLLKMSFRDRGLYVFDRGYDGGYILSYLYKHQMRFVIRSVGRRFVLYNGRAIRVKELCGSIINRRYSKDGLRFGYAKCYFKKNPITVVSVECKNGERLYFLCEGHLSKSKEVYRRIKSYFSRWKIEESYRFMKQQFGLERCLVRKYESIKTMLGISLFGWHLLCRLESDEYSKMLLEKMAKREKESRGEKKVCEFIHYRLSDGIRNALLGYNRSLFNFRNRDKSNDSKLYYVPVDYLLEKSERRCWIPLIPVIKRRKSSVVA